MINILFIDEHEMVRRAAGELFESMGDMKMVADAADSKEALEMMGKRKSKLSVIVLDLSSPAADGLDAAHKLHNTYADIPLLLITSVSYDGPMHVFKVGAAGYVHKGCDMGELESAIRTLHRGERYISDGVSRLLALRMLREYEGSPFDQISSREKEVLDLMIRGEKNAVIAETLDISPKTISTYRYRILGKLGVKGRRQLLQLAKQFGFYADGKEPQGLFEELG
ncbi:DNA-binding response regulator [Ectothiorhodospiraceae bacterium BW-2]|nr:DNA-binding response regulator [Ectothiorhodospiraceae bacterium BW-2]